MYFFKNKNLEAMKRIMSSNLIRKRVLFFLICSVVVYIVVLSMNQTPKNCFQEMQFNDGKTLKNILTKQQQPNHSDKNIFFHETSCTADGIIRLTSRQACAIESSARMNPGHQIYVAFTSQIGFRNTSTLPIIDAIMNYKNVHLNYLNITQYSENTPLKQFMQSGELFRSQYVNSHTSDILRYLTLWKYGGTYLDLDIVMLKNLNELKPNYAGAESRNFVAVGIINLEHETGHEIAELCLRDLSVNFNPQDWGNNGPGVLTRVLQKICNTKDVLEMIADESKCPNFKVLPIEAAYSIRWPEHIKFFREEFLNETLDRLSNSVIAHVWNKHSATTKLAIHSNSAYLHLARKHCPNVVSVSELF